MSFLEVSPICEKLAAEKFSNILKREKASAIAERHAKLYFVKSGAYSRTRTMEMDHFMLLDRGLLQDTHGRPVIYVSSKEYELFLHVELTQLQQELGD